MASGVYAIIHMPTGGQYVGASTDIDRRYGFHLSQLRCHTHHSLAMQRTWDQTPDPALFRLVVLEECDYGCLQEAEARWTGTLRPQLNGGAAGTHGGSRAGSGRPRVYSERATRTTVYLEPEEAQRLREIGGTVTGGIRVLLTESAAPARSSPCDIGAR